MVAAVFLLLPVALVGRGVELQLTESDFLQGQAEARHLRVEALPAHRGAITDRHGEVLAMSAPMDSVWADPGPLLAAEGGVQRLAAALEMDAGALQQALSERAEREFVYVRRHVDPELAERVMALDLPGVALRREYRRFYPTGEVTGHLLGFTNIDDRGQEGLELAYDDWLSGTPGAKRVLRDRLGRTIEDVERLSEPQPGRELALTVDRRLQYLAYRELKSAVRAHDARSGSLVLLDARSGDVLAMVNQPAFNPNRRGGMRAEQYRNRAVTDLFEPGSTIKPFTVAAALESGRYTPSTPVDTAPGWMRVGRHQVRDVRDYGTLDVASVISKSSNVGAARIALDLEVGRVWELLAAAGLGRPTGVAHPGEASGYLAIMPPERPIERATLAFGYGLSNTSLQLARAYAAIANDGLLPPVSLLAGAERGDARRIMSARTAQAVRGMMEGVVQPAGTAPAAAVPGYRVAGKTGTVRKAVAGGYAEDRYTATFAGLAPVSDPRFVCVVTLDEPGGEAYYAGEVAAPVFGAVMADALRLYNVAPDATPRESRLVAAGRDGG
ncbi:cell division protein [Spiribacter halobius]|uniref:Peptidoglycan D,D-transpeptidase FtsI n=1 Tax=Sediminicurvatus halobius TaxID=2182432 RepID=A0A2U2N837_9GAMM|nr:cell division protein [Spiribacter halobius]